MGTKRAAGSSTPREGAERVEGLGSRLRGKDYLHPRKLDRPVQSLGQLKAVSVIDETIPKTHKCPTLYFCAAR